MEAEKMKAVTEAILFAMGEPVTIGQLTEVLETDGSTVENVIKELTEEYSKEDRGIQLVRIEDAYQLSTKSETYEYLIKLVSKPKNYRLTDVQLETLSIIAYKQPVTKQEIESIRGVSSDHAVNRLLEAGLIEETGRLAAPGRPMLFSTTEEFLRKFGLSSKEELPGINTEKLETFKLEAEEEIGYTPETPENDKPLA